MGSGAPRADPVQPELPLEAGEVFPRMRSERAEFYIAQIRATLQMPLTGSREANLWDVQMEQSDRRFLCRIANANFALADQCWASIEQADRVRLVAALTRLREWVLSFHMPLDSYVERAFEPA